MGKREEKMLNVKQVAERIGAGESSVRLWCSQGRFTGARQETTPFGSYWLIPEGALSTFEMQKRGRKPTPKAAKAAKSPARKRGTK